MYRYLIFIFSISFLFTFEASASSGSCKSQYIYEPGVYFFATKSHQYAGASIYKNKWSYSGREGNLEDCKKFWRKNGDVFDGYIRTWENKMIVSKEEYCSAKLFHNWFGFGRIGLKYCKNSKTNKFNPENDYTNLKNNNPMYIYSKDVEYLCKTVDARCDFTAWGKKFKKHMISFLSGEHSSALAFTDDGDKYFKRPGYMTSYDYASLKSAQQDVLDGCEEYGPCVIVIEDNIVVDSRLKKQLIQSGFSGSVKKEEKHKKTKIIDDTKTSDLDIDTSKLKSTSNKEVCLRATKSNGLEWESMGSRYDTYVREAFNRNLSLYDCRKLTDRFPKVEIESSSEKNIDSNVDIESKLKSLKHLLDEGLISQEQYDEKSSKILDEF